MLGAGRKASLGWFVLGAGCALAGGCSGTDNPDRPQFDASDVPRDRAYLDARLPDFDASDAQDVPVSETPMDVFVPTMTRVRLANLIANPDGALPAMDFCLRPAGMPGATPMGPLLESHMRAPGVAWNEVSAYFEVLAGSYDVIVVSGTATDCNTPIFPAQTGRMLPPAGSYATLVVAGLPPGADAGAAGALAARVTVLTDRDPSVVTPATHPSLRLFHAVPSAALRLDVGIAVGTTLNVIYADVGFNEVGHGPMNVGTDMLGYYDTVAATGLSVGARLTCAGMPMCMHGIILSVNNVDSVNGNYYSNFLIQKPHPVIPGQVVNGALFCNDNHPMVNGLTECFLPE